MEFQEPNQDEVRAMWEARCDEQEREHKRLLRAALAQERRRIVGMVLNKFGQYQTASDSEYGNPAYVNKVIAHVLDELALDIEKS